MVGPTPVASIGSGSRSASSSVLVSTIVILALSHLVATDLMVSTSSVLVVLGFTVDSTSPWYLSFVILLERRSTVVSSCDAVIDPLVVAGIDLLD